MRVYPVESPVRAACLRTVLMKWHASLSQLVRELAKRLIPLLPVTVEPHSTRPRRLVQLPAIRQQIAPLTKHAFISQRATALLT